MAKKLLTPAADNPKTAKMGAELGIEAAILHLAPANLSGFNTCPMADGPCKNACLNTAGLAGVYESIQRARIEKTQSFFKDRKAFTAQLAKEIAALVRKATKNGRVPAVRLNGTSDIRWEREEVTIDGTTYANLMEAFPNVQFYDYTKIPNRKGIPANYHLTFSLSASNDVHAIAQLQKGVNVAVVLDYGKQLPETWNGYRVVNGDKHDFRYLDGTGPFIVALKAKGKAIGDTSGFVRKVDSTLDATRTPRFASQERSTIKLTAVA